MLSERGTCRNRLRYNTLQKGVPALRTRGGHFRLLAISTIAQADCFSSREYALGVRNSEGTRYSPFQTPVKTHPPSPIQLSTFSSELIAVAAALPHFMLALFCVMVGQSQCMMHEAVALSLRRSYKQGPHTLDPVGKQYSSNVQRDRDCDYPSYPESWWFALQNHSRPHKSNSLNNVKKYGRGGARVHLLISQALGGKTRLWS